MQVPFYRHDMTQKDIAGIARVVDSPILTSGTVAKEVEQQLAAFFGTKEGLLVNSWTNGAIACLMAMGVERNDEVIVPAMTFIASANVAQILGAKVVFVDVEADSLLLTPEAAKAFITPKTKVIIPVHLYGRMCDMVGFKKMLQDIGRTDIKIIEDCAHCFEGTRDGYLPGTHSDAAIFSFYATKNVTCGEGGAIVTNDAELAEGIRIRRLHGMSAGAVDRFKAGHYRPWDMLELGVKANLPDLLAALLPEQIKTIRQRLEKRTASATYYREKLASTPIRFPKEINGVLNAEHIFPIHVPPAVRDETIRILNDNQIQVAINYNSVPLTQYYQRTYGHQASDHPVSSEWGAGTLTLPFFPSISREEIDYVMDVINRVVVPVVEKAQS
ncbi:DegT/DnrJ/EryC1/StrS family aminotransferase [Ampullimonas aquatilis]|uniref:DegT/DnrJ/EryC1/StrS family aminotransferase n=1 Tax=Ampullimonas aquatilis TaxID=1341549 RepID=UPI003C780015